MKHVEKIATLTGIETEGDLAGEIVCEEIFLWKLARKTGERVRVRFKLPHGTKVKVDKTTTNGAGTVLYHIRGEGKHGWVTERFLIFA